MSKRDLIAEIKELQKRLPEKAYTIFGHQEAIRELVNLYPAEELNAAHAVAVTHYIAVRLVAILQSAFRAVIRDAIDYSARHNKPLPKIDERITLEMVTQFARNTVTLGEFVSHLLPLNSFGQMQKSFELATGVNLELALTPHLVDTEIKEGSYQNVARAAQELFTERNIICHEMRESDVIAKDKLGKWIISILLIATGLGIDSAKYIEI